MSFFLKLSTLLRDVIGRGDAKALAHDLNLSDRHIQRWASGEEPSPLHRAASLVSALHDLDPVKADRVIAFMNEWYDEVRGRRPVRLSRLEAAANAMKEGGEALAILGRDADQAEILREIDEWLSAISDLRRAVLAESKVGAGKRAAQAVESEAIQ